MSYRIAPPSAFTSQEEHVVSTKATAHPVNGLHDSFRYGLKSAAQDVAAANLSPLQARLEKWTTTQQQLQQTIQRNTFGLSLPMREAMEVKLVSESLHHPLLLATNPLGGSHNLALEILQGNDEKLMESDFMSGGRDLGAVLDVSSAMERSRGI
ncbi:proteasome maturation protein, partial [Tremellales sp. Uapishka_1]